MSAATSAAFDAVVAGAGPAGAVAAHVLARAGKRVLLTGAPPDAAHKIGEALPAAALRLLRELELPVPREGGPHTPIRGNLVCWGSDDLQASDFLLDPDGPGWRLDRRRFEGDLRDAAIEAGAIFRPSQVAGIERRASLWNVQLSDGACVEARWLIDATGRRAAIARKLGARRSRDARLVAIYALAEPSPQFDLDRTLVEAVCGGWWYAARLPNGAALAAFHLHPRDAIKVIGQSGGWSAALANTLHLAPRLASAKFHAPRRAVEACGARLDRFFGDGWIACGDAALSFDPVSSQGLFSAIHGGMTAARAVVGALQDDTSQSRAYSDRLETIRRIYLARWRTLYRNEWRWREAPFWSEHAAGP